VADHWDAVDEALRPEAASVRRRGRPGHRDAGQTRVDRLGHRDAGQSRDGRPAHRWVQSGWDAWAGDLPRSLDHRMERLDAADTRLDHQAAGRWDGHAG
jgi:hypothetical protein